MVGAARSISVQRAVLRACGPWAVGGVVAGGYLLDSGEAAVLVAG